MYKHITFILIIMKKNEHEASSLRQRQKLFFQDLKKHTMTHDSFFLTQRVVSLYNVISRCLTKFFFQVLSPSIYLFFL